MDANSLIGSAVVAACISSVVSVISSMLTYRATGEKLRREYQLEFAAERIVRQLLMHPKWEWRSFDAVKHHIGSFDDDELPKILVRAGAIRTTTKKGKEMWSLLDRNREVLPPDGEPAEPA
jgi:hypothetical protein